MPPGFWLYRPHWAKPYAMAMEPTAVTPQLSSEIAPTWAMFAGSMMMPEPIMFTATMNVSCIRFIFLVGSATIPPSARQAVDVVSPVALLGPFHFLGETRERVAPLLAGPQVGEPRAVVRADA